MIAGIDSVAGLRHYYIFEGSNNTERFLRFLSRMVENFEGLRGAIVLDNLSIHKTKRVRDVIDTRNNLELVFLPPYTSSLNPIEKLWLVAKGKWRRHLVEKADEFFTGERMVLDIEEILNDIDL